MTVSPIWKVLMFCPCFLLYTFVTLAALLCVAMNASFRLLALWSGRYVGAFLFLFMQSGIASISVTKSGSSVMTFGSFVVTSIISMTTSSSSVVTSYSSIVTSGTSGEASGTSGETAGTSVVTSATSIGTSGTSGETSGTCHFLS